MNPTRRCLDQMDRCARQILWLAVLAPILILVALFLLAWVLG